MIRGEAGKNTEGVKVQDVLTGGRVKKVNPDTFIAFVN